ncbi:hypothetical protein FQN57_002721 [Myotisia sp. PD_48]|nr:hypothetical protein FQN57_002721 [Myotisia sp. PD_48]
MMKVRARRLWTKEEDDLLRKAVNESNERGGDINWHRIASNIPDRNNKDCRKRWVYILAPTLNKGAWNKTEDGKLLQGIQKHGFRWALVSQVVGSRQPDQCSRRWHESLNPEINNDRWSLLEDEILREAVQIYGRRWTEIVDRYFPNRTPIAAKNRYTQRFGNNKAEVAKAGEHASRAKKGEPIKPLLTTVAPVDNSRIENPTIMPKLLWHVPDHTQSQAIRIPGPSPPQGKPTEKRTMNDPNSPFITTTTFQQTPSLASSPSPASFSHVSLSDSTANCDPSNTSPYSYYPSTSPQIDICTPTFSDTPMNDGFSFEPWAQNDVLAYLNTGQVNYARPGWSADQPILERRSPSYPYPAPYT